MTNTKNSLIAERYSDALVELAKDGKLTFSKISEDLNIIKTTIAQSKDLGDLLVNPLTSIDAKKEIIEKIFSNEVDSLIINFLKILIDKDRFFAFDEIIETYNESIDKINNLSRVKVVSAINLSEESTNKLKAKLEAKLNKNIILDMAIDTSIIAGLVIKIGDNIIDMSLKHKLEDLSKSITR